MKHTISSRIKQKVAKLRNKSSNKYKVNPVPVTSQIPGPILRKRSSRIRKNKSSSKVIPGTTSD